MVWISEGVKPMMYSISGGEVPARFKKFLPFGNTLLIITVCSNIFVNSNLRLQKKL